jgi:hypothetical protein
MPPENPRPSNDPHFAAETHRRWRQRRHRRQEDPGYQEEWWGQQCGHCRFWIPLSGVLGSDYGACTNPASPFDGCIMFEHDGCEFFQPSEQWNVPAE